MPICLDTQDTDEIIKTVVNIAPAFGGINLEDISAPRCFEIESRLKELLDIPVFHDDQHGTAIVVLAGIINGLKVTGKTKEECKVIINGAGSAGVAITKLLLTYGFKNVTMCDKSGILSKKSEGLNWMQESMMSKHVVSLYDMCYSTLLHFDMEQWDEKITDCINYLILLKALVKEEQAYGSH